MIPPRRTRAAVACLFAALALLVLTALVASACGSSDDPFIGVWKQAKGDITIEIKSGAVDGQYDLVFSTAKQSPDAKARFTLTGVRKGDTIELGDPTGKTQEVAVVTVVGDTLTITSKNDAQTYERVK
jgi:hypothetical protein